MSRPTAPQPRFVAERYAATKPAAVDREAGLVRGVRVANGLSRNHRAYPPAVYEAAVARYAAPVNVGHHFDPATGLPREAPPEARFGRLLNPRFADGGITADLQINPKHPFAETFLWAAENCPEMYSFSHLARVRWRESPDADGRQVAESILEVASVDIVTEGGTTATVFESLDPGAVTTMPTDPKTVAAELATGADLTAFVSGLFQALPAGVTPEDKQAAVDALQEWLDNMAADPGAATDTPAAAAAMESVRRRGRRGRWAAEHLARFFAAEQARKRREWADTLMTAEGLAADLRTDVFAETVAESFGNETRAKALIADRKRFAPPAGGGTGGGGGARSSPAGGGGAKSVKDLVADLAIG